MKTQRKLIAVLFLFTTLSHQLSTALAQGTAFTYQGRLNDGVNPANGIYDLRFMIYDAGSGGVAQGGPLTNAATGVSNGLFTVALDFGNQFPGSDRWLEISVRTNGAGAFTTLLPRQKLTAIAYAITAANLSGVVASTGLSGTYANPLTFNSAANSFSGQGTGLTGLDASQLGGGTVPTAALSNAWRIGGNAGTTPGTHFLGTTDNQPLELKVNNQRGLRLVYADDGFGSTGINVLGGSSGNYVSAGVVGATIGGGGTTQYGATNRALASFATVGGGAWNSASGNSATVAGGYANGASAYAATVGGGEGNGATGGFATVGGGEQNGSSAPYATVGGGSGNRNDSDNSTIGGGLGNTIQTSAPNSFIGGGSGNSVGTNSSFATIAGGSGNSIPANAAFATVAGGGGNLSSSSYGAVPGGFNNTAGGVFSFAAGRSAKALHNGAFVWADSSGADFASTGNDQFLIRAGGGVGLNKSNPASALDVNGTVTATGFSGNGAGLTALSVSSLGSGNVPGVFGFTNAGNSFSGNGAGLTNVNAATLGGLGTGNFWMLGGNGGTGGAALGTADAQPLKLIAGNRRALQLETRSVSLGLFETLFTVNSLGGASGNVISNGVLGGTVGGGGAVTNHLVGSDSAPNTVLDNFGTVGGGLNNTAGYPSGNFDDGRSATVAGGEGNTAGGAWSTIGGGQLNTASGNFFTTVGGGILNGASGDFATVSGGGYNVSAGSGATVPGGTGNYASGTTSFAAGHLAQALHDGTFVWADFDPISPSYASTGTNQFCVRARGGIQVDPQTSMFFGNSTRQMLNLFGNFYGLGVQSFTMYFRTDGNNGGFSWFKGGVHNDSQNHSGGGTELMRLDTSGNLKTLTGTIASLSDRNAKTDFRPVDSQAVLARVASLPISTWRYKNADASQRHLGPMAQDFYGSFAIGLDDKSICPVDESGVALAAIQGLNQKLEETRSENAELKARLERLEKLLAN